jgi:hypothetical protein
MGRANNNTSTALFWVVFAAAIMVFVAAPALAQEAPPEPDTSVTTYIDFVGGRDFADQGFSLTRDPVAEFGVTACSGAWCVDLWRAESLTGNVADHETDLAVMRTDTFGEFTVETKVAFFELDGPEVWDAKLTISHPLGERCEASASYEVMWAGFNDHVTRGELACSSPTPVEGLSVDGSLAVAYSTWSGSATPSYQLGVGYELRPGLSASLYLKGYEGSDDQNVLLGFGIAQTW